MSDEKPHDQEPATDDSKVEPENGLAIKKGLPYLAPGERIVLPSGHTLTRVAPKPGAKGVSATILSGAHYSNRGKAAGGTEEEDDKAEEGA